jgi:CRISPR-associated protein Cas4
MQLIPVSALSSWKRCPRQFYLSYVLEIEGPPKDVMILGLIKHKLHELIAEQEEEIIVNMEKADNPYEIFHSKFTKILQNIVTSHANALRTVSVPLTTAFQSAIPIVKFEANEKANRIQQLLQQNITGETLWNQLTPRIKPEYKISSEKLGLKGRIDRLECYQNQILPVELKSGNPPQEGVWEEHKIQAAAYALMLEEHFNTTVPEAIVYYVDHQSRRPVVLNPFLKDEIISIIQHVRSCLGTKDLPDGCGREYCKACKDPVFIENQL